MLKMHPDGGGRKSVEEIVAEARRLYGVELVAGVEKVLPESRAFFNDRWVASFTDARQAYYVRQNGNDFLEWQTAPVPTAGPASEVVFALSLGMGYGSPLPQPSGQFDLFVDGNYCLSFRVTKENLIWRRDGISFGFFIKRLEQAPPGVALCLDSHLEQEAMAVYGLGLLKVPRTAIAAGENGCRLKIVPRNRQSSRRWLKLDLDIYARLLLKADLEEGLAAICGENRRPEIGGCQVLFGDIHAHSGERIGEGPTCGTGTVAENYRYARDVSCLDVCAVTDHDWQIEEKTGWRHLLNAADEFDRPGGFITLPAFEWTSLRYGHRNVYYADSRWPYFSSGPKNAIAAGQNPSPGALWQSLRACGARAITAAHHPSIGFFPVDWTYADPEFDRLVEIYSGWGNSEYYGAPHAGSAGDRQPGFSVQDALARGHRLGFVASADAHDGNPGNAQYSERQPHLHHHLGSGLVAVLAEASSRKAVFDALYQRRCYATTGTRILLDFRVNGKMMGSEIRGRGNAPREIIVRAAGTAPLAAIEIIRNNAGIHCWRGRSPGKEIHFTDEEVLKGPAYYYVRVVQEDGEMAWSSPVWTL